MKHLFLLLALSPVLFAAQPNIVIILADDLGYGDVQCYNPQRGKIPTPNLDRLASEGMRFTDAHTASSVCTPTRYATLTGRYAWRTRLQSGVLDGFSPRAGWSPWRRCFRAGCRTCAARSSIRR